MRRINARNLITINCRHWNLSHFRTYSSQPKQHITLKKVPLTDFFKGKLSQNTRMYGHKTIGGVHQVPITAGKFREKRETCISSNTHSRHFVQIFKSIETIAFGVICFSLHDGFDKKWDIIRIMLAITVNLHKNIRATLDRVPHPG